MTRRTVPQRIVATAAIAVLLAVSLSGCALFSAGAAPRPVSTQTKHSTPKPAHSAPASGPATTPPTSSPAAPPPPAPTLTPVPQGTVVAEGDVRSPLGSIHFHYRMVSTGDNMYAAEYSDFTSTVPVPVSVTLIDIPPSVGDGLTYHGVGDHPLGGPTTAPPAPTSAWLGTNPSYLGSLVTYSSAPSADGVPQELGPDKILSVNSIQWSVPARQTNVHPVDSGPAPNAQGRVSETTPSGAPASYVVARGDTTQRIADRFGIPVEYLLWLNPSRRAFDSDGRPYEQATLNLDPEAL